MSLISQGDAPLAVSPLSPGPAVADAPAVPLHAAARRQMASGIEAQLAALRRLDSRQRVGELGFFVVLFAGGTMINRWGLGAGSGAWSHALARIGFLWRFFAATLRMDDTPIGRANLEGGKDRTLQGS